MRFKRSRDNQDTEVTPVQGLGIANFTTSNFTNKCILQEPQTSTDGKMEIKPKSKNKESLKEVAAEAKNDSGRFYRFVRKHFLGRGREKKTQVKEISILPEGEEFRWASRSASSSAASRTSVETNSSTNSNIEVVHDMDEENTLEALKSESDSSNMS
ncbi:hypothetical protein CHS0354_012079 [Potamilus streckersoni]|uniref:Uncharacterized protein n=1 Tax=Potamilus streckersoni TaxID=2493646 RepID=A0AAE0SA99_9BIVA|nr:hypothetical protein CHS0354_012079 [Potamilus streckersoni]